MRFWHFLDLPFKEVKDLQDVNLVTVMLETEIFLCVYRFKFLLDVFR